MIEVRGKKVFLTITSTRKKRNVWNMAVVAIKEASLFYKGGGDTRGCGCVDYR